MCKTIKFHKKLTPEQINDLYDDEELFKNFIKENENDERISDLIKKCQITSKEELNILQALELALKETYLNESSKKVKDDNNLTHKLK